MIAVFTRTQHEYRMLNLKPENMFRRIRDDKSVFGLIFTGAIRLYGWDEKTELRNAHEQLMIRQPELMY